MTYKSFTDDTEVIHNRAVALATDGSFGAPFRTSLAKLTFDKVFALLAIVLLIPAFLVISGLILLADGRPVFYAQERVGRNGRRFRCWKFRTMVRDADTQLKEALGQHPEFMAEWLATRKLRNDPRILAVGRFLRRTSLDELPQFWNVLAGDMSVVGPRPVVTDELVYYGADVAAYVSVRPGLTGAWQISGRSNTTYEERVALDLDYINHASFWRDMRIVMKTVRVVLSREGAL